MDRNTDDGVEQIGEFTAFYRDGEGDTEGELAAVGVGLDFVALR